VGEILKPLKVIFEGEPAIDAGGVRKEFFQLLVEQLLAPDFGLFTSSDEGRTFWFSAAAAYEEAQFFLVGLVLGLAIYNATLLHLHFPKLLWRRLQNAPVQLADLKEVNPALWRGLSSLLAFEGDVQATYLADFTASYEVLGERTTHELIPGGGGVAVTNDNRAEYVEAYVRHLLVDAVAEPFAAFQKGCAERRRCGPCVSRITQPYRWAVKPYRSVVKPYCSGAPQVH